MQRFQKYLWGILFIFSLIFIICSNSLPSTTIVYDSTKFDTLEGQWTQIVDNKEVLIENPSDFIEVDEGESLVLQMTLPEITIDKILLIYTENQELVADVSNKNIYSFLISDKFSFLKTPGNNWNEIILTPEMSGQTLTLSFTSQFKHYSNVLHDFYFVREKNVQIIQAYQIWFKNTVAIFILLMAIISYTTAIFWKRKKEQHTVFCVANIYLCISLWLFAQINLVNVIFTRPIICYYLSMLLLRVIPVVIYQYIACCVPPKYKAIKVMGVILWANLIGSMILQFVFHISFIDLISMSNILVLICIVIYFVTFFKIRSTNRKNKNGDFSLLLINLIIIGGVVDVFAYGFHNYNYAVMGVATSIGVALNAFISSLVIIHNEHSIQKNKALIEKLYSQLQNTTLTNQIKAHFLYNSLNSISALCKYDPEKADFATVTLARYMRSYMNLIHLNHTVDFLTDIELGSAYLEIEKIRFDENFSFTMNLNYTDFQIPPLTLQPVFENAVIHGLRPKVGKRHITIDCDKKDDFAVIKIQDNGIGFDVNATNTNQSIGIENIKKRLKLMVDGSLEIESEIEKGTCISIYIPLHEE